MTPKQQTESLAAQLGVEVSLDRSGRYTELSLLAPTGKRFANGPHELIYQHVPGETEQRDLWTSAVGDLHLGVIPCNDPDCDWCKDG